MSLSVLPYDKEHDLVVIGSGPGGEGAAMKAAKSDKSVVLIERDKQVGGGCTHVATIPSKALRHSVQAVLEFRRNPIFASFVDSVRFTFPQLLRAAESVIRKQVAMRRDFYLRNHIAVVHGFGRFVDPHTVEVDSPEGATRKIHGKNFVIATGSRPYRPGDVDFTHARVFDSDTILRLDHTPDAITIYGAGVVGCEYASIFRNLGVKVNLVNSREKLLSFLDDEIIDALSYHLRDQGVVLRHNEEYERVEPRDDGVILHLKSGKKIKSDVLLWAQGRTGNTDGMSLPGALGVTPNSRGQLEVDDRYRLPAQPHVYAVGDVLGSPSLASASYDQGRFAASHMVDPDSDLRLVQD
ncbi:MAG: Si-specific NAD(P)(+) transhydrogenase, partial [Sandaracinaceae bacterium]|nr:Si-specific NAD(P)(+) transhydrogenase [Sandaracinaceae bacterium]